jgi:peptidyl-dipeptidase Dcp
MNTVAASLTARTPAFGPGNPFYAPSTLPLGAPHFDRIQDADYQPAFEAGMAEQLQEVQAIAANAESASFENTIVAMEQTGRLLDRVSSVFGAVTGANTNPVLQEVRQIMAPKMAAHHDAIYLNADLFARVQAVYENRAAAELRGEALRLAEYYYREFVHGGANLSRADKTTLKKMNEEMSSLQADFRTRLLAANQAGAFATTDKEALAGLSAAQLAAAAETAAQRNQPGWVLVLQNTTQQPLLANLSNRATRQSLFEHSWNRTERGDAYDTRALIQRIAQLRAEKAKLLGFSSFAAWKLEDQMAATPGTALQFMDAMVAKAMNDATEEAVEINKLIAGAHTLEAWDWDYYAAQVRKAKYDIDDAEVQPYLELNAVLLDGVFYAANQLYGLTFRERYDLPVYHPDVRVFDINDADGKLLALFYGDFYKRDNKNGGAWMSSLVSQSKLLGTEPVIYNVCNYTKPPAGEPALISFSDVTTLFHEFGHALHGMFSEVTYPSFTGTSVARDFVEFPSQFNEHWATWPGIFEHYARHHATGAPMPAELMTRIVKAEKFNAGYSLVEILAAAQLDMQWHTLSADTSVENPDAFEKEALRKTNLTLSYVPPRYRSSYFSHIWASGYAAGYYAYLWSEKLDDDSYQWFKDHGGLTRANGDRLRRMVLSRGNTEDLATMYKNWLSAPVEG